MSNIKLKLTTYPQIQQISTYPLQNLCLQKLLQIMVKIHRFYNLFDQSIKLNNKMSKEENIKNYLHMLGMEDEFYSTAYSPRKMSPRSNSRSFEPGQLTDWHNQKQYSVELSSSLPKLSKQGKLHAATRASSMDMTQYHSSLLKQLEIRKKQQSMFINPVVIKFNTQVCGNALRRSQLLFHRILHNEGERREEDPGRLRDLLKRIKPKEETIFGSSSPPKTERCSGILRMLKRREQVRIMKRKKQNPEALTAIKLQSK